MPKRRDKGNVPSDIPRVYSYVRFSTPEQRLRDSERRQVDMVRQYAHEVGFPFDESLCMFDRGLSGFHGAHRKKGMLGAFLRLVEKGSVPPGSILCVENADRLSREGILSTLKNIIGELWKHNITLVTLSPRETYEPRCDNHPKFLALLLYLQRAYDESRAKSERVRAARDHARGKAREEGRMLTARCPAWLRVEDGKFKVIPEARRTIRTIFGLYRKGVSVRQIEKRLNMKAAWTRPNGWRHSYIKKILANPAVIGEYQPHTRIEGDRTPAGDPIPGYYPRVIDDGTFHAVQEKLKVNRGKGGRNGKATNILRHLIRCAYCGGSMRLRDRGAKGGRRLLCDRAARGLECVGQSIKYDEVERLVLENCRGINPEDILPGQDEQMKVCQGLRLRIQSREAEIRGIEKQIENFTDQIGRTTDAQSRDRYEARNMKLQNKIKTLRQQLEADRHELGQAELSCQSLKGWLRDLNALRKSLAEQDDVELRMRTNSHLRELIDRIEVFTAGFGRLFDYEKDDFLSGPYRVRKCRRRIVNVEMIEYFLHDKFAEAPEGSDVPLAGSKEFRDLVDGIVRRRMSREGRFVRVHFKTGACRDLVPEGSLADGMELRYDQASKRWRWESKGLDLTGLLKDFEKSHGGKEGRG